MSELQGDICGATEALDYYASLATTSVGHHVKLDNGDFAYVTKEPYGIVAGNGFTFQVNLHGEYQCPFWKQDVNLLLPLMKIGTYGSKVLQ